MAWSSIATVALLFAVGVASSPMFVLPSEPSRELLPPKVEQESTLATELMPPPEEKPAKEATSTLLLINVYAVKNFMPNKSSEVLHNDVIKEVPDDVPEPLAIFLLIVEADNETHPVNLDDVAKDLVEEGFTIEKIDKDGETRLIKVDLDSLESSTSLDNNAESKTREEAEESENEVDRSGKLMKIRRKRTICLGCDLDLFRGRRHLHRHRNEPCLGGCGGGGGGGYYPQPIYPRPQPVYPQPQTYYPQPCTTCGNNRGGYGGGGGGGNAFAQASAQASASSYGGY